MESARDVVVTGIGVLSPIGIGSGAFWTGLVEGRSGVKALPWFNGSGMACPLGAEIPNFEPGQYVRPRKALKVMSRDIQLAVAAADLAVQESGLAKGTVDPDRFGVVFGADMIAADLNELVAPYRSCLAEGKFDFRLWGGRAMSDLFPLWMLKYLPNMPACHIGIIHDARGPNNTLTLGEVSSLAAVAEAMAIIRRGQADVVLAGGTSSRINPTVYLRNACRQVSRRCDDPAAACRPFDADRDGMVYGEGAAVFVLESRAHAEARGASPKILARLLASASTYEPQQSGRPLRGDSIRSAIRATLNAAGITPGEIGLVSAHGLGTTLDDRLEAEAIRDTLGDAPVTALKSYFGNLCAAAGVVEMAASVLALRNRAIPATRNYQRPDPACPIQVVHGQLQPASRATALVLNHAATGQAAALLLGAD